MLIRLYAVDQDTGEQTFVALCGTQEIADDDSERFTIDDELSATGRCWIGGGAAQLFYATKVQS